MEFFPHAHKPNLVYILFPLLLLKKDIAKRNLFVARADMCEMLFARN